MSQHPWRDQDIAELREVANRIAALIVSAKDRRAALKQFIEAIDRRDRFAELLVEYTHRWFYGADKQLILLGPELFWVLTEPGEPDTDGDTYSQAKRVRDMLLLCVFDDLTNNHWPVEELHDPQQDAEDNVRPFNSILAAR